MMQKLRGFASSWAFRILFVVLLASFGFWGIGDIFRSQATSDRVVATVDDVRIDRAAFDAAFRQDVSRLQQVTGGRIDAEKARAMGLDRKTLERMTNQILMDLAARDTGILVDDSVIARWIASEPVFRNAEGKFDRQRFLSVLQSSGLTEAGFASAVRQQVSGAILLGAVPASVDSVPDSHIEDVWRGQQAVRGLEVITLPLSSIAVPEAPTDETLKTYMEAHADRYAAPEYRSLVLVPLSPADMERKIQITDDELNRIWQERKAEFQVPERRDVQQILVTDRQKAEIIHARAMTGNLEKAAGETGVNVTAMPAVTQDQLPAEIADSLFSLKEGEMTGPLESVLGWHVLKVVKIHPGGTVPFEEARQKLMEETRTSQIQDGIHALTVQLQDTVAAGDDVGEYARSQGLQPVTIQATDQQGLSSAGAPVQSLRGREKILETAFSLDQGQASDLVQDKDNTGWIVAVTSITPSLPRPFEAIRDSLAKDWTLDQQKRRAADMVSDMIRRWKSGESGQAIARAAGARHETMAPLGRQGKLPGNTTIPPSLVVDLFRLETGAVTSAIEGGRAILVRAGEVRLPGKAPADADIRGLRPDTESAMASELVEQFRAALAVKYPVQIHADRLSQAE
ncbi:MAG: SurA N-terminal domain-containing protein [Pseudomonadota bacterium]|nr:SurA N-terminal domain-containing protein [Pseudomonadota bacterium]